MTADCSPSNQSTFVTVVAWVLIVISGFTSVIGIAQNIMLMTMFDSVSPGQIPEGTSAFTAFMFEHFYLVFLAFLLVSLLVLVSSIGLLKRREWARKVVVGVFVLGVIYMLGSMVFTLFVNLAPTVPENANQAFRESVQSMESTMRFFRAFMVVFSLGLAGVMCWVVWKLRAKEVRSEFTT